MARRIIRCEHGFPREWCEQQGCPHWCGVAKNKFYMPDHIDGEPVAYRVFERWPVQKDEEEDDADSEE